MLVTEESLDKIKSTLIYLKRTKKRTHLSQA